MAKELKWTPSARFCEISDKESITPNELKEALHECFTAAVGGEEKLSELTLKKQFSDLGVNWDEPTKEGIIKVMGKLSELAQKYRSEEVIRANYNKMMKLVNKCRD